MAISTISSPAALTIPGSVLQVVNGTYANDGSTTSTSFASSGLYATITPKFSTSKILVIASSSGSNASTAGQGLYCQLYRGTSGNGSGSSIGAQNYIYQVGGGNGNYTMPVITFVDSPASTSALTYTVMQASSSSGVRAGFVYGFGTANLGTMTLLEIAA